VLVIVPLSGQPIDYQEFGVPLYEDIERDGLERGASIRSLTLGDMGRAYICANDRVHVFNGLNWEAAVERAEDRMLGLSLVKRGPDGRIYLSFIGDWGYLERDELGRMGFNSLKPDGFEHTLLSQPFNAVSFNSEGDMFLLGQSGFVCQLKNGQTFGVRTGGIVGSCFEWKGKDYVSVQDKGLYLLEGRKLVPFKLTSAQGRVPMFTRAFPLGNRVLLATFSDGIWEFDGEELSRIPMQCDALLDEGVDDVLLLSEGYLLASVRGLGVLILNDEGREISRLSGSSDKAFWNVSRLESRGDGVVWAMSSHSVVKIHFPAEVTQFDQSMGLSLHWPSIMRSSERLYLFSSPMLYEGLYGEGGNLQGFREMDFPESMGITRRDVTSTGDSLVIATDTGIWEYDSETHDLERFSEDSSIYQMFYSGVSGAELWVVSPDHISLYEKQDGDWALTGRVNEELPYINHMVRGDDGEAWFEGGQALVHRFRRNRGGGIELKTYGADSGLVEQWVNVFKLRGEVL